MPDTTLVTEQTLRTKTCALDYVANRLVRSMWTTAGARDLAIPYLETHWRNINPDVGTDMSPKMTVVFERGDATEKMRVVILEWVRKFQLSFTSQEEYFEYATFIATAWSPQRLGNLPGESGWKHTSVIDFTPDAIFLMAIHLLWIEAALLQTQLTQYNNQANRLIKLDFHA